MQQSIRIAWLILLPIVVFMGAWATLAAPEQADRLVGGFQLHTFGNDKTVSDEQVIASQPSLGVGSLTGDLANPMPFVAFAQRRFGVGTVQDILVRFFDRQRGWVTLAQGRNGGSLNRDRNVFASDPNLAFGGPLVNGVPTVPWVAWVEPVVSINGRTNIFASFLSNDAQGAFWQITGETGGNRGVPSLNASTSEYARNPAIATGPATAGATTYLPWVAWDEDSPIFRTRHLFVARAESASGPNIVGGFRWLRVGQITQGQETGLNVDLARNALNPDLVFSGPNNTTPWVTWYEDESTPNQGRAARVFTARAVVDGTAQGGFNWVKPPACGTGDPSCPLNTNPDQDARNPKIASGSLVGEDATQPKPWVVFEQLENNGAFTEIRVKQWTGTTWRPVGGPLNVNRFARAFDPDIFFIGNVPHVAWVEDQGGFRLLYVKHLGDARPAFERWDLDAQIGRGINVIGFNPAIAPSLHGTTTTPYVAWQEQNRFSQESLIFEARRIPEGAAWGSNDPSYKRSISVTRNLASVKPLPLTDVLPEAPETPAQVVNERVGTVTITTSCDHVNGWDNITAIEFVLEERVDRRTISPTVVFNARFNADTGQITVEDPTYPGLFLPPVTPGEGHTIETPFVSLHVNEMSVGRLGPVSPAVDIQWVISFKRPTQFKEFTQLLNIKSNQVNGKGQQTTVETGFFEVGSLKVTQHELVLPHIRKAGTGD